MALTYTTYAAIRTACGVTSEVLSDAEAEELGQDAEDVIDEMLGVYFIDEDTGRKLAADDVDEWQWEKLGRATAKVAKFLFDHPDWLAEQRHSTTGGDVSTSGPVGSVIPGVAMILDQAHLRRLTGTCQ